MLELILLFFLSRKIGDLGIRKGVSAGRWKRYAVLSWIGGEILGLFIGILMGNAILMLLLAYGLAARAYLLVRSALCNKPDAQDEWLESIGNHEAQQSTYHLQS